MVSFQIWIVALVIAPVEMLNANQSWNVLPLYSPAVVFAYKLVFVLLQRSVFSHHPSPVEVTVTGVAPAHGPNSKIAAAAPRNFIIDPPLHCIILTAVLAIPLIPQILSLIVRFWIFMRCAVR
jgi:hypothetical protein